MDGALSFIAVMTFFSLFVLVGFVIGVNISEERHVDMYLSGKIECAYIGDFLECNPAKEKTQ